MVATATHAQTRTLTQTRPPQDGVYRVDDHSLLLGFYRRVLWDRLTARIPRAIHPNTLTIASQVFALLALVTTAVAVAYERPALFAASAFCLLSCLTLDNVDGAHARRTNQCSALGELLDHGLDGVTSAAVLVVTCLVLHLDAVMMVIVCALGAVAFASVFWEQSRTGILTLPKVSPTEGVTLLALWEIVAALFGDPWWLRFSLERVTVGTIAILVFVLVHVLAVIAPFVRAAKAGVKGWEVLPLFVVTALQVGVAVLGAKGIVPALTVGLIAADVTCRMILLRYFGGERRRRLTLISPPLYFASLPALVVIAAPHVWSPTGWALVSLSIVTADYGWTLWRGGRQLLVREAC